MTRSGTRSLTIPYNYFRMRLAFQCFNLYTLMQAQTLLSIIIRSTFRGVVELKYTPSVRGISAGNKSEVNCLGLDIRQGFDIRGLLEWCSKPLSHDQSCSRCIVDRLFHASDLHPTLPLFRRLLSFQDNVDTSHPLHLKFLSHPLGGAIISLDDCCQQSVT